MTPTPRTSSLPFRRFLLVSGFGILVSTASADQRVTLEPRPAATQPASSQPSATQPSQADLERQLTEKLTNAVMNGSFTAGANREPRNDKYTIVSVRKLLGDNWLFNAKVQYRGNDLTIPMIVPIKWAGDTPVISVTNFGLPGMGTYTARVLIYGDEYAGTWTANATGNRPPHGGQMWGRIERAPATQPAAK